MSLTSTPPLKLSESNGRYSTFTSFYTVIHSHVDTLSTEMSLTSTPPLKLQKVMEGIPV